ncbi:MAG: hypothetical protein NTZ14_17205 [Hyphomicrobiales bacterium]|nr:hypothetical protein [Hyphomicrobiales bacterium]
MARPYAPLWGLDPEARLINHGSFGATPLEILAEQVHWRSLMGRNTARFFVNSLPGLLREAAANWGLLSMLRQIGWSFSTRRPQGQTPFCVVSRCGLATRS